MSKLTIQCLVWFLTVCLLNAVVKNENKPYKGEWDFDLHEVWSLDKAGGNPLAVVRNIRVDGSGSVFFVDRKFEKIIAFNADGKELLYFGKKGEGPGEILRFGTFFLQGEYIIVDDRGNRFHYFTKKGKYKNTIRYNHSLVPKVFIDDSRFVAIKNNLLDDIKKMNETLEICEVYSKKRNIIASLKPEDMVEGTAGSGKEQLRASVQVTGLTSSVVVGANGTSLFFGRNDKYFIRKTNFSGKELLSFSLEGRNPKPVSIEDKKKLFKGASPLPPQMVKTLINNLPDQCTFFSEIHPDDKGFIYVYAADLSNKKGQEVDIFSNGGKYLYHSMITLPGGLKTITSPVITGDYLYIYAEDEEGEQKLVKYKIKKPCL
jgi:hypothetical protein